MNLSPRITLEQMVFSQTALRTGIDNTPNAGEIANLTCLCETLLEPALDLLGVAFHYDSGFRCPALNAAVKGSKGSAHMDGRACDFIPQGMDLTKAFDILRHSGLPFDQIIIECGAWIHFAIAKNGVDPRGEMLKASGTPGAWTYVEVPA